jgi:DNA repair exonuclease SbcCD ATPase subunit
MQIRILRIVNFLTIGDSGDLALADKGLVLIQGKNEDDPSAISNGSGKSSIPDALCWALYGVTARGETGDAVVNDTAKKDCMVQVTMQDGDSVYCISRYRKDKTFKNTTRVVVWNPASTFPLTHPTDLTRGTEKETQDLIEQILGCSYDVFKAAIYSGQEDMPDLPRMTDKQLKLLIEQAAGVERLERAYEVARAKENDLRLKHTNLTGIKASHESQLVSAKSELLGAQARQKEFEEQRPLKQAGFQGQAAGHAATMKTAHQAFLALEEPKLKAELEELNKRLASHKTYQATLDEHNGRIAHIDRILAGAEYDLQNWRKEREKIQGHIDQAPNSVGKPCQSCGKPHTKEDLSKVQEILVKQLYDTIVLGKSRAETVKQNRLLREAAVKARDVFAETIPDVSAISARVSEIHKILGEAERMRRQIITLKGQYDAAHQAADRALTEVNPYTAAVEMAEKRVKSYEAAIRAGAAELEKLEGELAIASSVTTVFSPAGVRAHILDTVTPFLNDRTADYLNALSDGSISATWSTLGETAKGELREKFNIEVKNGKGGKSFGLLSGGEKRKVRLASMLALQDLVASRATKNIALWIGDEIDDALDPAGLERLMGILERKARERGTVLVVSHNELTDWIDNTATVVKRGGRSKVEGALCA